MSAAQGYLPNSRPVQCNNGDHDHSAYDENGTPTAGKNVCPECYQPTHYDEAAGEHQHDNPTAPDCFLIRHNHPLATPCDIEKEN